jgi:hypothetical protein
LIKESVRRFQNMSDRMLRGQNCEGESTIWPLFYFQANEIFQGVLRMKRFFFSFLCLTVLLAATAPLASAQERSRFGRKSRTAAIIGGGAIAGALIAGKKGAAIGAGSGALYAMNRRAATRHFNPTTRRIGTVLGGSALGAGLGAAFGGKRAAAVGALAGAGTSYIYTRRSRRYARRF